MQRKDIQNPATSLKRGYGFLTDEGIALGVWSQILASGAALMPMSMEAGGGGGVNITMKMMVGGGGILWSSRWNKNPTAVGGWGGVICLLPLHSSVNLSHKSIS